MQVMLRKVSFVKGRYSDYEAKAWYLFIKDLWLHIGPYYRSHVLHHELHYTKDARESYEALS